VQAQGLNLALASWDSLSIGPHKVRTALIKAEQVVTPSWDPCFSLLLFRNGGISLSSSFNSLQTWETQGSPPIGLEMQLGIIVIGCMLCSSNLTAYILESTQPICIKAY
jgi:hypothetical protein